MDNNRIATEIKKIEWIKSMLISGRRWTATDFIDEFGTTRRTVIRYVNAVRLVYGWSVCYDHGDRSYYLASTGSDIEKNEAPVKEPISSKTFAEIRKRLGLTQKVLAATLGIAIATVWRYENGDHIALNISYAMTVLDRYLHNGTQPK